VSAEERKAVYLELDGKVVAEVVNVSATTSFDPLTGSYSMREPDPPASAPASVGTRFFPVTVRAVTSAGFPSGRFEASVQVEGKVFDYVGYGDTPDKAIEELRAAIYRYENLTVGKVELPAGFTGAKPVEEVLQDQLKYARADADAYCQKALDLEARIYGLTTDLEQARKRGGDRVQYWVGELVQEGTVSASRRRIAEEAIELVHTLILDRDRLRRVIETHQKFSGFGFFGSYLA
jgi:hypothetical protein